MRQMVNIDSKSTDLHLTGSPLICIKLKKQALPPTYLQKGNPYSPHQISHA